nr:hypothetical protein [Escherichia coli]
YITTYLNNILIYSKMKVEYKRYLKDIISRLYKTDLTINIRKYEFYKYKMKDLNLIISREGLYINPEQVSAIFN